LSSNLEEALRTTFARQADWVPGEIGERLSRTDYHPRSGHTGLVGLAGGTAVLVGAATYLLVAGAPSGAAHRSGHPANSIRTVHLAGYTLKLPVSSQASTVPCAPSPPPTPGLPETVTQAGGVFTPLDGGCLHTDIGGPAVPSGAQPVTVGTYYGYAVSDPAESTITVYVDFSTTHTAVFTATDTGLTEQQLIDIAANGLVPCSPELEDAPACS
jgi:hypothetical protein